MLTKKQHELLSYIDKQLKSKGVPPSYDEMKDALGLASKSGIHRLILALQERGFIRRLPHKARALEVLKHPENKLHNEISAESDSNVIHGEFDKISAPQLPTTSANDGEIVSLPLWGKIAAGTPIEALRDTSNTIDIPASMLGQGDYYALDVDGDSIIEAGIYDGDTVIIQQADNADNGTIVVALVDNTEVTLKRLRRKGNSVALEPANSAYETRICGPDQVKVQGKIVGLFRKYD
jgi:repressor LexA